jgi:transcription termination factor Rho
MMVGEEFKGTGNMNCCLRFRERRIFPASSVPPPAVRISFWS